MKNKQKKKQNNKNLYYVIIQDSFYFLSSLLVLGLIFDLIIPHFFALYFNVAFLFLLFLINTFLLILYVRR